MQHETKIDKYILDHNTYKFSTTLQCYVRCVKSICTPWSIKPRHYISGDNFVRCEPIFTVFAPLGKQDAQLSQRDRAAGYIIVFAKSRRLERGDNIWRTLQVYLQPLWYNRPENLSNSVKKTQNKGYCSVQGHSRSSRSVPIESPYAISY